MLNAILRSLLAMFLSVSLFGSALALPQAPGRSVEQMPATGQTDFHQRLATAQAQLLDNLLTPRKF